MNGGIIQEYGDLDIRSKEFSDPQEDLSYIFCEKGFLLVRTMNKTNLLTDNSASFELLDARPPLWELKWFTSWCPMLPVILLRREAGLIKLADDEAVIKEPLHVCFDGCEQLQLLKICP